MQSYKDFLKESEGAVNVAGDAVAGKDVPLTDKTVKRKDDEDEEVTLTTEEATRDPDYTYSTGKWGKYAQFVIPNTQYEGLKLGRAKYSNWSEFIAHPDLQEQVKKVLYRDGAVVMTSDTSGASVILRHQKVQRMRMQDEFANGDNAL